MSGDQANEVLNEINGKSALRKAKYIDQLSARFPGMYFRVFIPFFIVLASAGMLMKDWQVVSMSAFFLVIINSVDSNLLRKKIDALSEIVRSYEPND